MKWLKNLPLDIYMLLLHIKTLFGYLWEDIKSVVEDIFTIPKR